MLGLASFQKEFAAPVLRLLPAGLAPGASAGSKLSLPPAVEITGLSVSAKSLGSALGSRRRFRVGASRNEPGGVRPHGAFGCRPFVSFHVDGGQRRPGLTRRRGRGAVAAPASSSLESAPERSAGFSMTGSRIFVRSPSYLFGELPAAMLIAALMYDGPQGLRWLMSRHCSPQVTTLVHCTTRRAPRYELVSAGCVRGVGERLFS